ncbi:hypothetical protein SAMN05444678_11431 [Sphingomonas sp. YR710]|uniref:hypothetical protein n=1 Tax=Sphingomonas sp. YR710 TaxID=1882773 RepID=UPI00089168AE|nr:hypothetical protein [Sphingomonas sp. YR710]SDD48900.1 hypothetical protein SAMN05444678_11431 [Sphingomonas sp. YR710]
MRITLLLLAGLALPGCTPNDITMGGAAKHNYAMQVIDPDPRYAGDAIEGGSGAHATAAMERYRKGTVKEPQTIRITSGLVSGSSGSSTPK